MVILHGLNMVYKVGSYRPADSGFGADDARWLRRNGFNTIRLGIIYKGLEPAPPTASGPSYDEAYLRSIARTEAVLAKQRIFTLLDFHQDLYNERFQGEGWPDWQVLDDGEPAEPRSAFPATTSSTRGSTAPSTTSGRTSWSRAEASRTPMRLPGATSPRTSRPART